MKKILGYLVGALGVLCLAAALVFAQGTPFNGKWGTFGGNIYVPSVFNLIFGDNTSSDVYLAKNGANILGITGAVGGSGSTANTTTTPAGPFDWGTVAFSSSTAATVTLAKAFANSPACFFTDSSNTGVTFKYGYTTSTNALLITASGSNSDTVAYACYGNPN